MDKVCKNCKLWIAPKSDYPAGDCSSSKWVKGYLSIKHPASGFASDCVHVEDDEGWGFETGPEFGCIHWISSDGEG